MKRIEHAVLLIGSAKREGESTSAALGSYLCARLQAQGVAITTFAIHRALRTPARTQELLAAIDACDLLILAFPLYVDTLPALTIQALETIAAHRYDAMAAPAPWFLALANCGFPEAAHNDVALAAPFMVGW
jgi:NAD(P)H-dependent FMN reductase